MSDVFYFQRYHNPEDMHSSNAILLLKRVYFYKPKMFYRIISSWTYKEVDDFLPNFNTQIKGKESRPDFSISQSGFRIIVEAKEKYNSFSEGQMKHHLNSLLDFPESDKIFIALAPKFSETDNRIFDEIKKTSSVTFVALTYMQLYETICKECNENQDAELLEMLEEYKDYCSEEGLIDDTDNTIMVRLAGQTLDFCIDPKNFIYYDKAEHRYEGFRYLGLYKDKKLMYLGQIEKIIRAAYKTKEDEQPDLECLVPYQGTNEESDRDRVVRAMTQNNLYNPHCYFLVEKFIPIENFVKTSKGALYGKKKFYLSQFELSPKSSVEQIASKMKNKTWEEFDNR